MSSVLDAYLDCEPCRDALAGERHHRYHSGVCLSCDARDIARAPTLAIQRGRARLLKERLLASDFEEFVRLREAWLAHDAEARHAA